MVASAVLEAIRVANDESSASARGLQAGKSARKGETHRRWRTRATLGILNIGTGALGELL